MKMIHLKDGSIEFIDSNQQLQRLVEEHLGEDAGSEVEQLIADANYTERKIYTDLNSYESSLDSWNSAGYEIIADAQRAIEYIENNKRLDRNKLISFFQSIQTNINNEL